ncbi:MULTISPECIES: carboxylesterase/lipase family protein [unclassified Bradyrhizobium]|uniref:carboxylesterase/lipase family protein n=1 Tax=unclassified Bradyrhizobium TaxID=2631580 RepID=UPI0020B24EB8|nr:MULTISPECIES: carboxylesterase family protein [unclassified Bradyrhizobium]MCP3385372.1 carboxylesterase family protein [Bradyrhizobium sp. CCGUVB4N]MCP3446638.1 carboxylesterase family protein [Bradyrhizobium sp. CCGUVB14]
MRTRHSRLVALIALMFVMRLSAADAQNDASGVPKVQTSLGRVEGARHDDTDVFLGIPYALPPTGERRLAPPVPAASWSAPLRAIVPPSACPQLPSPDPAGLASSNEDCLYLNIWRPTAANSVGARGRPVMVWIHGGGFVEGYGAAKQYDATHLALAADAVVVTVNYRVGALGFLAAPALDDVDARHISGNYGLQDLQMALHWIAQDIAAFGGDPGNVTVMGESAGANAVLGLLASPGSEGLFHRAIVQSATDGAHTLPLKQAERERYASSLDEIGCGTVQTLACLRSARSDAFLRMTARPTMIQDGIVLPLDPFEAFRQGRFMKVPVLIGTNAKENYLFTARVESDVLKRIMLPGDIPGMLKSSFGDKADVVAAQYVPEAYATASTLIGSALTDRRFACMANLTRNALAASVPVYGYELDIADPMQQQPLVQGSDLPNLSYHTTDLGYLFNNDNDAHALPGRHAALSRMIAGYWSAFAATGEPNGGEANANTNGSGPERLRWRRFTSDDRAVLSISDTPVMRRDFADAHKCAFWESSGLVAPTW